VDWHRRIDGYCERTGPEFWAEPLNAATNGAFLVATIISLVLALRRRRLDGPVVWLVALTAIIGTGSFLFHTYATVWAAIADTGPISLFILSYFAIAMRRFAGLGWGRSLALTLAFLAAMWIVSWALRVTVGPYLGGSQSYFPALLAMLGVGLWLSARGHPAAAWLLASAGMFAVSLSFRTLDQPLCEAWPAGTHFVWHVLNAVVLGTLIAGVVRHGRLPHEAPCHT
jgi:hypothetical protein